MKYVIWSVLAFTVLVVSSGCASNPMKNRLERNLVYQCSLDLIDRNIAAPEAERICSSAHKAEMDERTFAAGNKAGRKIEAAAPARAPASASGVYNPEGASHADFAQPADSQ